MEKIIFLNDKTTSEAIVEVDDLLFDGKTMKIPSSWTDTLYELVKLSDLTQIIDENDRRDCEDFIDFLKKVKKAKKL